VRKRSDSNKCFCTKSEALDTENFKGGEMMYFSYSANIQTHDNATRMSRIFWKSQNGG